MNRIHITMKDETLAYVDEYKRDHELGSRSETVEEIIKRYQEGQPSQMQVLAKEIVKVLYEEHGKEQTRIRMAATTADINSQVIIEILNSILYTMQTEQYFPTEEMKSEVVSQAEIAVRGRIARYKVMRDSKAVTAKKKDEESPLVL